MTAADPARTVRKRHVFYVPGHDPAGGRRYREIYRAEAAKQAAVSGYRIDVEGLPPEDGVYRWQAEATIDGVTTRTTFDFLLWNDLVKQSLNKSMLATYWLTLRTFWAYLASGTLAAIARVRPVMLFSTLYPIAVYLLTPVAGLLAGLLVAWLAGLVLPVPGWATALAMLAGMAAALALLRRYDQRFFITYLVLAYAYIARNRGGTPPGLY